MCKDCRLYRHCATLLQAGLGKTGAGHDAALAASRLKHGPHVTVQRMLGDDAVMNDLLLQHWHVQLLS